MNTILIKKDDIYKLTNYEIKDETLLGLIDTGFMFDKFLVRFEPCDVVYKVKIDEDWNYKVIQIVNGNSIYLSEKQIYKSTYNLLDDVYEADKKAIKDAEKYFTRNGDVKIKVQVGTAEFIMKLMCYIMDEDLHREVLYKESVEHEGIVAEISNDVKRKIDNKVYSLNNIIRYVSACKSGIHKNITCECWSVRGHYRHYKNGKVTFIKSYTKGVKRNETPRDKVYEL